MGIPDRSSDAHKAGDNLTVCAFRRTRNEAADHLMEVVALQGMESVDMRLGELSFKKPEITYPVDSLRGTLSGQQR